MVEASKTLQLLVAVVISYTGNNLFRLIGLNLSCHDLGKRELGRKTWFIFRHFLIGSFDL